MDNAQEFDLGLVPIDDIISELNRRYPSFVLGAVTHSSEDIYWFRGSLAAHIGLVKFMRSETRSRARAILNDDDE